MFAVVEIQGKQYEVRVGDVLHVDTMHLEADKKLSIDKVLLLNDGKETKVGTPYVAGVTVEATSHGDHKGEKIRVFKMKAKKRYRRTLGFRASQTTLEITSIAGNSTVAKKPAAPKKTAAAPKKAAATPTKKAPAKKAATPKKETAEKK